MAYKCGSCGTFFTGKVCPVCGVRSPVAMIGRPRDLAVARQEQLTPRTSEGGAKPAAKPVAVKKPKSSFPVVPDPTADSAETAAEVKVSDAAAPAEKPVPEKDGEASATPKQSPSAEKNGSVILPADAEPKDGKAEKADESPQEKPSSPPEKNPRATPAIPDFSALPKPPRPSAADKPFEPTADSALNTSWGNTPSPPPEQVAKNAAPAQDKAKSNGLPRFEPLPISVTDAVRERKTQDASGTSSGQDGGFLRAASAVMRSLLKGDSNAAVKTILDRPSAWRLSIVSLPICAVTTGVVCWLRSGKMNAASFFRTLGGTFLVTLLASVVLAFVFLILDPPSRSLPTGGKTSRSGQKSKGRTEKFSALIVRAFAASVFSLTALAVLALPAVAAELFYPALTVPLMMTGCGLCFALLYQTVSAAAERAHRRRLLWFAAAMIPAVFAIYRFAAFILFRG